MRETFYSYYGSYWDGGARFVRGMPDSDFEPMDVVLVRRSIRGDAWICDGDDGTAVAIMNDDVRFYPDRDTAMMATKMLLSGR